MRSAIAVALLALAACGDRAAPPDAAAPPRARPLAQDGTAARALTSAPDRARVQLDLAAARGALRTFRGEHGAWPGSLEELGLAGLAYPHDLVYDARSGTVTSRTYPGH